MKNYVLLLMIPNNQLNERKKQYETQNIDS